MHCNQVCFRWKTISNHMDFTRLKCQLTEKKFNTACLFVFVFQVSAVKEMGKWGKLVPHSKESLRHNFCAIMPLSQSEHECYLSYFIKYNGNHWHFQNIKQLYHEFETNWVLRQSEKQMSVILACFISSFCLSFFKLVDKESVDTSFLRGLRYANVSLTHSGVDTLRN